MRFWTTKVCKAPITGARSCVCSEVCEQALHPGAAGAVYSEALNSSSLQRSIGLHLAPCMWAAGLKDRIKVATRDQDANAGVAFSPRETSLSVNRYRTEQEQHEAGFFQQLEVEVSDSWRTSISGCAV
jgi:hypothetical protein